MIAVFKICMQCNFTVSLVFMHLFVVLSFLFFCTRNVSSQFHSYLCICLLVLSFLLLARRDKKYIRCQKKCRLANSNSL